MKKYFSFIMMAMLMALPLVFAGCSSDDDDDVEASQLVGTWCCISSYLEEKSEGVVNKEENEEVGSIFYIQSDGNFKTVDADGYENGGTWALKNGKLELHFYDEDFVPTYSITEFTGSRMTIVGEYKGFGEYQIVKITLERVE